MKFFKKIGRGLKSSLLWMNLFAMAAVLVLLFLLCQWGIKAYTRHGQGVEVPKVTDMLFSEAEYKLNQMNLEILVVDSDYVKSKPAGCILEQTPSPGMKVKSYRTVYVTINAASSPTLVLPDLADNSSFRQAQVKLTSMGFNMGPVEYIDGEKDWVYAVKYRGRKVFGGDRVPSDATLVLVVGSGMYGGTGKDSTKQYRMDDLGDFSDDLDIDPDLEEMEQKEKSAAKKKEEEKKTNKPDDWF
ncbi:MAG: PASTA domain-containing protein [Bacteroidaceae bacterium]|nr:PASTA domain-containing protein [Bacteroidaceae bacterium]